MPSVVGTHGGVIRRVSFAITGVFPLGTLAASVAQFPLPRFKHGAIGVKSSKLRVQ